VPRKQKILYGAGEMGKRAYAFYAKEDAGAVCCFVDDHKHGETYLGKPVLSFDDFVKIYKNYNIVICVFDLSDILHRFERNAIYDFTVWDDSFAVPVEERSGNSERIKFFKKIDGVDTSDKLKILYGAGEYGELALCYYGEDNVYAFADTFKAGDVYCEKKVLHPEQLVDLQSSYEIIICVKEHEGLQEYLSTIGVRAYKLFIMIDDVRYMGFSGLSPGIGNERVRNDLSKLDLIENSELVEPYYRDYMSSARRRSGIVPDEKRVCSRFLGENSAYGYFEGLRDFANVSVEPYEAPAISHGIPYMDSELALKWLNLIEAGTIYKDTVINCSRDARLFPVGQYIKYARSFYTDSVLKEKKEKYGRVLTVFPMHSIFGTTLAYDEDAFIRFAMNESKKFDTVLVCAYITDYYSRAVKQFRANGAKIVCAGFGSDPSFVRRLKSIMLLSDGLLTNGLGTHIPFALSLGVPIRFVAQHFESHSFQDPNAYCDEVFNGELPIRSVLPTDRYEINDEILAAYEPCAGFSLLKTKDELAAVFNLSKRIIQTADYKQSKYIHAIRSTYRELSRATTADENLQFRLMREALPPDYEYHLKKSGV
jgi:hypothetical protein